MDDFIIFCFFCCRYVELIFQCKLGGYLIVVVEVFEEELYFGFFWNGIQKNLSLKILLEWVIYCIFYYLFYKIYFNGDDMIIVGCEVKFDCEQVYQIGFDSVVDVFFSYVLLEFEVQ